MNFTNKSANFKSYMCTAMSLLKLSGLFFTFRGNGQLKGVVSKNPMYEKW